MRRALSISLCLFVVACDQDPVGTADAGLPLTDVGQMDAGPPPIEPFVVRLEAAPGHIDGRPWPSDHWRGEDGWNFPAIDDDDGFFYVPTRQIIAREQGYALRPVARVCFTRDLPLSPPPAGLVSLVDAEGQTQAITQLTLDRERHCLGFSAAQPLLPRQRYFIRLHQVEGPWAAELASGAAPSEDPTAVQLASEAAILVAEPFTVQGLGDAFAARLARVTSGEVWQGQPPQLDVLRTMTPEQLLPGSIFGVEQGRRGYYLRLHIADLIAGEDDELILAGEDLLDRNRLSLTTGVILHAVDGDEIRFGIINGDWSVSAQVPAPTGSVVRLFQELFVPQQSYAALAELVDPAFSRLIFAQVDLPLWRGENGLLMPLDEIIPAPGGSQTLQVSLFLPRGDAPQGGWPIALLGPGYAGMRHDLAVLAETLCLQGYAVAVIDPVAHGGGPATELHVPRAGALPVSVPSPGRSRDRDGNGRYRLTEGMHASWAGPDYAGMTGIHDANRQTALDYAALLSVLLQTDLNEDGASDFDATQTAFVGHSNGGRYGMLLVAHDARIKRAVLLAPPGDGYIPYISSYRPTWAELFDTWLPPLSNEPSSRYGLFNEGILWPGDSVLDAPLGFQGINRYTARRAWLAGDAEGEGAAALWRHARAAGETRAEVMVQLLRGDPAVVNPDTMRLVDAAGDALLLAMIDPDQTEWRASMRYGDLIYRHLIPVYDGRSGYPPADLAHLARQQMAAFIAGADDVDLDGEEPVVTLNPERRALRFLLGFDFWELRQLWRF